MKKTFLIFLHLLFTANLVSVARERILFNDDWTWHLGDFEIPVTDGWDRNKTTFVYEPEWDASSWSKVDLPHDWMIEQERDPNESGLNSFFPDGVAWYRKDFVLPAEDAGKHIEIQFDGIYRDATVWINGYLLGTQYDGYTSFYHDISEMVRPGESNSIIVRADASGRVISRWYSGGGIYRNVWLSKTDHLHVKNWGTYISTPKVSASKAMVSVRTEIENLGLAGDYTLETILLDANGDEVAKKSTSGSIDRVRSDTIDQQLKIRKPMLWSLNDPYLYKAVSRIHVGGKVVDEYESKFGVRSIEFDANKGFFLNGESILMKGVCLHHDAGSLGAAVPIKVWERRLKKLKEIGCNAIRTSHNPMAPEFMDLCDRMGFLVMDEFVDKWEYWASVVNTHFRNEWQKNFENTIRRDRNHPSVVIWSVGNENHPSGSSEQNQGLREYSTFVHNLDPTRPVVSGMERGADMPVEEKVEAILKSCSYMDLIALNYGEQWCKRIHEANPGKPYVSTESYRYFNSEEEKRHTLIERSPWIDVIENDSNIGMYIWVGINYLGEVGNKRDFPHNGSTSGLLDVSGMEKEYAYLYKAFWSEEPTVRVAVYEKEMGDFSGLRRNWSWPLIKGKWDAENGAPVDLVTYSNCEEVELYLNDRLIGSQKLADNPNWIINWADVAYEKGTLRAVGKNAGEVVCEYELTTAEEASQLELEADSEGVATGEIVHIEVLLKDKNGTLIVDESPEIYFDVKGGKIIALENGNPRYAGSFANKTNRKIYKGSALCILKAGDAGALKLKVKSEGLPEEVLSIPVR